MKRVTIFVLLAMVAVASAKFGCCREERSGEIKEAKKSRRGAIFSKPSTSHAVPKLHPTGDIVTLAAKNEITPVEAMDSRRWHPETIPKPKVPIPMSPPRGATERGNSSPIRDTAVIPTPMLNSVPIAAKSRSAAPIVPMRSHVSNHQVDERNGKPIEKIATPQAPPMPPKLPSYKRSSAGLTDDDQTASSKIPMPPAPPKLPNFSKAGTSAIKDDRPVMSNLVAKAPPAAPPMPPKISSYQKPSMGLSHASLTAGRGGLRPVQTQNSNPKPTQLYGKPEGTESERSPNPIKAADLMASKKSLRPLSQTTKPPVVVPQSNHRSFKPMQKASKATNDEVSGVTNLVRRFDNNPPKSTTPSNPMLSEFEMISQRRNRINKVNWDQFDRVARKL